MDMDWVIEANAMSAEILKPDLNIFIDVLPETSMQRLHNSRSMTELYETLDNLHNVRKKYFEAFDKLQHQETIFITNGDRSSEEISNDIWKEVEKIFKQQKSYA